MLKHVRTHTTTRTLFDPDKTGLKSAICPPTHTHAQSHTHTHTHAHTHTPGYMELARENYRYAVKAAIVDHQFGMPAAAAHLSAANVQPVKVKTPVPPQGCVNLRELPLGSEVAVTEVRGGAVSARVCVRVCVCVCVWGGVLQITTRHCSIGSVSSRCTICAAWIGSTESMAPRPARVRGMCSAWQPGASPR